MTTHGLSNHPLYHRWKNMKRRCEDPSSSWYYRYGGRDINVCKKWRDSPSSFVKWAIANGWNPNLVIDRIDNDDGYFPENCRIVTPSDNNCNIPKRIDNSTGYIGVYKAGNRYKAEVHYQNRKWRLGSHKTAKKAAIARDKFIIERKLPHKLQVL